MNTFTINHGKAAKTMSFEGEILDYVLYSRALGNAETSNEVIFKLWSMNETFRDIIREHFKNCEIVLWKKFLTFRRILTFLKDFHKKLVKI